MKPMLQVLAGCAVILFFVSLPMGCRKASAPPAQAAPPVVVVEDIAQKTVPKILRCIASTEARNTVDLAAQVQGYLVEAPMEEGRPVEAGALLFLIDPRPYSNALEQANAQIKQAEAALERARLDVERFEPLVAANAIPRRDLDNAQASLLEQSAALMAAQAARDTAQLNLDFCSITAPLKGLAGRRNVDVGNLVTPGEVLATVSDLNPIQVWFSVSELDYLRYLQAFAGGQQALTDLSAELVLSDGGVYSGAGRVNFLDRAIRKDIGTLTLRAEFDNPELVLRPGQYGTLNLTVGQLEDVILVPVRAISQLQSLTTVMVVKEDNTCEQRTITLGDRFENYQVVTDGLDKGERVIIDGLLKVRQGAPCTPMTQDEYAAYMKKVRDESVAKMKQLPAASGDAAKTE